MKLQMLFHTCELLKNNLIFLHSDKAKNSVYDLELVANVGVCWLWKEKLAQWGQGKRSSFSIKNILR